MQGEAAGKGIDWVFFDLGSTLVDESGADSQRFGIVLEKMAASGMTVTLADLIRCYEDAATQGYKRPFLGMLKRLGLDEDQAAEMDKAAKYRHELETLHAGAPEILTILSKKYKLGVIANQGAGAEERLKAWAIHHHFGVIVSSTEAGLSKPDPKIFELALSQAACEAGRAVMVGDRLDNDMGPAKKLGLRTILVRQGVARYQEPYDEFQKPDVTVRTLAEVPAALERL